MQTVFMVKGITTDPTQANTELLNKKLINYCIINKNGVRFVVFHKETNNRVTTRGIKKCYNEVNNFGV